MPVSAARAGDSRLRGRLCSASTAGAPEAAAGEEPAQGKSRQGKGENDYGGDDDGDHGLVRGHVVLASEVVVEDIVVLDAQVREQLQNHVGESARPAKIVFAVFRRGVILEVSVI